MKEFLINDIKIKIKTEDECEANRVVDFVRDHYSEVSSFNNFNISKGMNVTYIELDDEIEIVDILEDPREEEIKNNNLIEDKEGLRNFNLGKLPINVISDILVLDMRIFDKFTNEEITSLTNKLGNYEKSSTKEDKIEYIYELSRLCRKYSNENSFSNRSKTKLSSCHKLLQAVFNIVSLTNNCTILQGHRGEEEQNDAYERGVSQLRFPRSKHNKYPSMAVDVAPFPIDWKDEGRFKIFIGKVLATSLPLLRGTGYKLVSGIDWDHDTFTKDHTFLDHPHFELVEDEEED